MDANRRRFFSKVGLVVAAPAVGVAKVAGITPKSEVPKPFETGDILTAKELNGRFDAIHRRIDGL